MNEVVFNTLKEKDFILKNYLIKTATELKLTLNDTLLLVYFMNQDIPALNIEGISQTMYLSMQDIMESFSKLKALNLITVNVIKRENGTREEVISLDNIIKFVTSDITDKMKKEKEKNIFEMIESEFGRPLSRMEYDIVNDWGKQNFSDDLIEAALKEAVYNNAKSLKYINAILLAWKDKGYKSASDIQKNIKKESETNTPDLFEYNWLDEE